MTSKEFQRRSIFYENLNDAACLFKLNTTGFIFRATLCFDDTIITRYVDFPKLDCFDSFDLSKCKFVSFDRFTFSEFKFNLGYFISFLHRCSKSQYDILKFKYRLDSLFSYADSELNTLLD